MFFGPPHFPAGLWGLARRCLRRAPGVPEIRQIARQLAVSRRTVRQAIAQ